MSVPTTQIRRPARKPGHVPPGDAGDALDPKPTTNRVCEACGTKYPLGKLCGYCRGAIKAYRDVAVKLLEPFKNKPRASTAERPELKLYMPQEDGGGPAA